MSAALALALSAAVAVSACVPNRIYRPGGPHPDQQYVVYERLATRQFEPAVINEEEDEEWPYRLAFIEFDDRGEMFKRQQLTSTLDEIAKIRAEGQQTGRRPVIMLFVHGWKNNASPSNGNVWGFRQVLAGLSKQYAPSGGDALVLGIYIGWRGAVLSPPVLKEFTVFDRERKSQNLPGAHMVEALLKIAQAARGPAFDDAGAPTTLMVGHSFGAAVLETALTQTLVGLAVNARVTGGMRWPADLIMFVNSAQQADRSYQLIEAFHQNLPQRDHLASDSGRPRAARCVAPGEQRPDPPAMMAISSVADAATRVAFFGAQAVQRPFNSLRRYDADAPNFLGFERQTPMFLNATAHLRPFQTHELGRPDDPVVLHARQHCEVNASIELGKMRYDLVERPDVKNRTPYWVLQMPASIVPDHTTIFTPMFRNFIITLIDRPRQMADEREAAPTKAQTRP